MATFPRILVVVPAGAEAGFAIRRALTLAAAGDNVHVIACVHDRALERAGVLAHEHEALRETMMAAASDRVRVVVAGLDSRGVDITHETAWVGDESAWLASCAREGGFALLVVAAPAGEELVEALLAATHLPLLLAATDASPTADVIAVVDPDNADPHQRVLDVRIEALGTLIAAAAGVAMHRIDATGFAQWPAGADYGLVILGAYPGNARRRLFARPWRGDMLLVPPA